jgi:hypothetical protein
VPDPGTIVTIVGLAIAGVVWLVRLEGRHDSHERECIVWRQRADERHKEVKEHLGNINEKLDRVIERVS